MPNAKNEKGAALLAQIEEFKDGKLSIEGMRELMIMGSLPISFDVTLNAGEKRKNYRKEMTEEAVKEAMKNAGHEVKGTVSFSGMTGEEIMNLAIEALIIKARPGYYKCPSDQEMIAFLGTGEIEIEAKKPAATPWNAGDGKRGPKSTKKFDVQNFDPSSLNEEELDALRKKLGI